MRLTLTLREGTRISEHVLEFRLAGKGHQVGSRLSYVLDGEEGKADCVPVVPGIYSVLLGGQSHQVQVERPTEVGQVESGTRIVTLGAHHFTIDVHDPRRRRRAALTAAAGGPQEIRAPMPGKIVKVLVERNQQVASGAGLLVIEAMKMQNELRAPRGGTVAEIYVANGNGVETGARLVRLV